MFGASLVAGAKKRPAVPALPTDASIDVAGHATGATTANEFTGFTNPVGSVSTSSSWTSPSVSLKYLFGDNWKNFIVKSTGEARDVEVTTWGRNVIVFLRLSDDGKAIFFHHNGESTNGTLEVGVVTGKAEGLGFRSGGDGTYTVFYTNSDLAGTVTGYSKTDTAGDTFTFGVSGWEVFAKFNGTEFWRSDPEIRWPMNRGKVACQGNNGYGFRDITVDWKTEATIYSNPATAYYDMRDFGFRSVSDTGSINVGTNAYELTVANPSRWAVGDKIIVSVGGESGAGARNTVGVGGTWPALHYADDATMEADTGQASGVRAYADDTGKVRQSKGDGTWYAWDANLYYLNYKAPRALLATVTGKSGSVLTLDTAASASTTNAGVYLNNYDNFDMFADGVGNSSLTPVGRYRFPPGLALDGGVGITLNLRSGSSLGSGVKIQGDGRDIETFIAPDGANSVTLVPYQADYVTIHGIWIRNNIGLNAYGLGWTTNGLGGFSYPQGIRLSISDYCQVLDSGAKDSFAAVTTSYAYQAAIYRCKSIITDPQQHYVVWQVAPADSSYVDVVDCEVDSNYMIAGAEFFRSDYCTFTRLTMRNAVFSANSSGGWLVDKLSITLEENSNYSELSNSQYNPVVDVNSNIGNQSGNPASTMNLGGTLRNFRIVIEGVLNADDLVPVVVSVNVDNPNVTIEGTEDNESDESPGAYIEHPGWQTGTNDFWGVGVRNSGTGTIVRNVRFNGDTASGKGNIHTEGGTLTASDYVADAAATGSYVTSDTGRQTNAEWEAAHP